MSETLLIRCPSCNAANRVLREKIEQGLEPVCGRCQTPLPVAIEPVTVTDATFATEIERAPLPVLLDMWAAWCRPCLLMAPVLEELAVEMAGRVRVAKMNVDENPVTSERFKVRSLPTLLVFKDGREIQRLVGMQPKSAIVHQLEPIMA
jgi:thioredoxin 2